MGQDGLLVLRTLPPHLFGESVGLGRTDFLTLWNSLLTRSRGSHFNVCHRAGEPLDASKRKTLLRSNARKRWSFLTPLDLTMIHSELQLAQTVRVHTGISKAQSETDVHEWLQHENLGPTAPPALSPDRQTAAIVRPAS